MSVLQRPQQKLLQRWHRFWLRALCLHWHIPGQKPTYSVHIDVGRRKMLVYRCPRCGRDEVVFV